MQQKKYAKTGAKKSFGQHFLIDSMMLDRIVQTIYPQKTDTIIEIGSGKGVLTKELLLNAKKVIGIELDNDLIPLLKNQFRQYDNFELIHADILDYQPDIKGAYKLVGNIPYNLTTKLFEKIAFWKQKPAFITFLLQKEAGERIIKNKGKNSPLSVCSDMLGEAKLVFDVPPHSFDPPPHVQSVVLYIDGAKKKDVQDVESFYTFVCALFRMPRKTLLNNLSYLFGKEKSFEILKKCSFDSNLRPEHLTFEELRELYISFDSMKIKRK